MAAMECLALASTLSAPGPECTHAQMSRRAQRAEKHEERRAQRSRRRADREVVNLLLRPNDFENLPDEEMEKLLRSLFLSDFERLRAFLCAHYARLICESGLYPETPEHIWSAMFHCALKVHASTSSLSSSSDLFYVAEYHKVSKLYQTVVRSAPTPTTAPKPVAQHARDRERETCVRNMVKRAITDAVRRATHGKEASARPCSPVDTFAEGVSQQRSSAHREWLLRRSMLSTTR